jgi:NADPH-dependent 2,4-dienoyl-CoA reductase/sulfur reductase-like enzyme/rhodanese-related sulfurtransferase
MPEEVTMADPLKIVIVGGVAAGPKAAARARRLHPRASITILEKGDYISYSACGLPFLISGEIPDVKHLLASPVGVMRDAEFFRTVKDIDFLTGKEALAIDRAAKTVQVRDVATSQTEIYPYDKLVLATGALPVRPRVPGIDVGNVFVIRQPRDGLAIMAALAEHKPRRAALIGAGAIGLEVAEALVDWGVEVTVVEAQDRVFPALLDFEMGALVQRHLESKSIKVRTGETVTALGSDEDGLLNRVYTSKGEFPAELAVVAVGVRPNVDLARDSGLAIGETGAIQVDQELRTSDPDIYAGGDCAENWHRLLKRPVMVSSGQLANIQGRIIGTNITGGHMVYQGMVGTAVAKVFDYTVGATGLSETAAKQAGFEVTSILAPGLDHAHYLPDALFVGLKMVADRVTGRVLGVQVVGPGNGAKRLDVAAAAITLGATVQDFTQFNLGYSPPYSVAIDLLVNAAQVMQNKLTGVAQTVSPLQVQELTDQGEDFMLLDVRTPAEFQRERLKHPKAFAMPLGRLRDKALTLPKDKLYIPFCQYSLRGYEAEKILEGLGFTRVKFMDGGVAHWPFERESSKEENQ